MERQMFMRAALEVLAAAILAALVIWALGVLEIHLENGQVQEQCEQARAEMPALRPMLFESSVTGRLTCKVQLSSPYGLAWIGLDDWKKGRGDTGPE